MSANQADLSVQTMCRVLRSRPAATTPGRSARHRRVAIANAVLTERIRRIHAESDSTYGSRTCVPTCATRASASRASGSPG